MYLQVQNILPSPIWRPRSVIALVQLAIHIDEGLTFTIENIAVTRGENSLFVRMPRVKENNVYVPFVQLSAKMKRAIDDAVLPAVEKWLAAQAAQSQEVGRG
jgi:DNA-binding cell septation regulator SpoVG